ncbi:MAG TPA: pilin, partial [Burkholderiales bacterium]|nr:pilin [Burkholderiales bacterium]
PTRSRATFVRFRLVEGGIVAYFDPRQEPGRLVSAMHTRGFTLLEMMVVIGVVAILALMAIPTYQDKFIRDQIAEALPLADIAKPPVALSWAVLQTFPADNAAAGLPVAEKIVNNTIRSVAVQGGAIDITFGNKANKVILGKILTLRPAVVEDAPIVPVTWVCGYATAPEKMTVKGENKTNIPPGYLPIRCRL